MGRIVFTRTGAARRPSQHGRALSVLVACVVVYIVVAVATYWRK